MKYLDMAEYGKTLHPPAAGRRLILVLPPPQHMPAFQRVWGETGHLAQGVIHLGAGGVAGLVRKQDEDGKIGVVAYSKAALAHQFA